MTAPGRIGLVGGTFDPFHLGHLAMAHAARLTLALDQVRIVPASVPPHRAAQPRTSAPHRFAMVAMGIANEPGLVVDDIELTASGPSYTASTLARLHARGLTASQLFFITGADAFAEIASWYQFPAVLDAANFVVIARPGMTIDEALSRTPELRSRVETAGRGGRLQSAQARTGIFLVEARTRDVSSTAIRERLAAQQPIDDLVPAAVARHIDAHHLYGAGRTLA